jgi:hypothetical protein
VTSPARNPPGLVSGDLAAGARLSVWPTAQQDARTQRRGRYLPASTAHPAKMLPAIAATAIARYTEPGDLVADPMCGIGTTLVEAVHQGRDGLGVEYEDRWARVAAANVTHARSHGAAGTAEVIRGDARQLPALIPPDAAGRAALVITSPPYGPSVHGQVTAEHRHGAAGGVRKYDNRYGCDPVNLASRHLDELLEGFTMILARRHHRPALAAARGTHRPARRRPRRRRPRRPGLGRPARCPARRAARRPADRPALVLPARQPPQGPPPRRALAPDRARGRAGLPQPALSRREYRGSPAGHCRPPVPGSRPRDRVAQPRRCAAGREPARQEPPLKRRWRAPARRAPPCPPRGTRPAAGPSASLPARAARTARPPPGAPGYRVVSTRGWRRAVKPPPGRAPGGLDRPGSL